VFTADLDETEQLKRPLPPQNTRSSANYQATHSHCLVES